MDADTINLKLVNLSYLLFGEDKVRVIHDSGTVLVSDSTPAWRWIIRAIARNFDELKKIGGTVKNMKDIGAQFETDGMIVHVVISNGCMLSKEGVQLFSILMDNDLRDMIHKILSMPDLDYKNTIRLFSEIALYNELITVQQVKEKQNITSLSGLN
jgi:heterodisulfide reductase subunit B